MWFHFDDGFNVYLWISAGTIWMTSVRVEVELSGTMILLDVDFGDWPVSGSGAMRELPVCISFSVTITSPSQIIIFQSLRWHNARNMFPGVQLKSHSRVFSVLSLNHLLQGWIQLFLQAPINPTINHGPNKIVLIINLPTPWYGLVGAKS